MKCSYATKSAKKCTELVADQNLLNVFCIHLKTYKSTYWTTEMQMKEVHFTAHFRIPV